MSVAEKDEHVMNTQPGLQSLAMHCSAQQVVYWLTSFHTEERFPMERRDIRKRQLVLMERTIDVLGNILQGVTQEEATTLRDGPDGWTILEALGHLEEFDGYFQARAIMIRDQDYPQLPGYDEAALAKEHAYNANDLRQTFEKLRQSRQEFIRFFEGLSDEQWERAGVHPENGHWTMEHALMQPAGHDLAHIEQITHILATKR